METAGWELKRTIQYLEIIPRDDKKEHYAGDECWCMPRIEYELGCMVEMIILHNALDGRK